MNRRGFFGRLGAALAAVKLVHPKPEVRSENAPEKNLWSKPIVRSNRPSSNELIIGVAATPALMEDEVIRVILQSGNLKGQVNLVASEPISVGDILVIDGSEGNVGRVRKAGTRRSDRP